MKKILKKIADRISKMLRKPQEINLDALRKLYANRLSRDLECEKILGDEEVVTEASLIFEQNKTLLRYLVHALTIIEEENNIYSERDKEIGRKHSSLVVNFLEECSIEKSFKIEQLREKALEEKEKIEKKKLEAEEKKETERIF